MRKTLISEMLGRLEELRHLFAVFPRNARLRPLRIAAYRRPPPTSRTAGHDVAGSMHAVHGERTAG